MEHRPCTYPDHCAPQCAFRKVPAGDFGMSRPAVSSDPCRSTSAATATAPATSPGAQPRTCRRSAGWSRPCATACSGAICNHVRPAQRAPPCFCQICPAACTDPGQTCLSRCVPAILYSRQRPPSHRNRVISTSRTPAGSFVQHQFEPLPRLPCLIRD